jgi:hypothetical protein
MATNNVVKEEDRKSLSVAMDTHARIARLIRVMSAERDENLNQDDIVREALDCLERERSRKK